MNKCFHCQEDTVVWDSDFTPDEMGIEGEGVVHLLHCGNCGAVIQYTVLEEGDERADSNV